MSDSSNTTSGTNRGLVVVYTIWIFEFLVIGVGNLLVAAAILRFEALRQRKEYLILCGLAFADGMNLMGNFCGAIERLSAIYGGTFDSLRSTWDCLLLPSNILWLSFEGCANLMLSIVSIDRLLSIACPLAYLGFGVSYAHRMLAFCFGHGACVAFSIVILAFLNRSGALIPASCFYGPILLETSRPLAMYIMYIVAPIPGLVSVVLYGALGIIYRHKSNAVVAAGIVVNNAEKEHQRKLTKTLAVSSVCTLVFVVLPTSLANSGELLHIPRLLMQLLWMLPCLNPLGNLVIYYKRQPEIKMAVSALLKGKTMPNNVQVWKNNTSRIAPIHVK